MPPIASVALTTTSTVIDSYEWIVHNVRPSTSSCYPKWERSLTFWRELAGGVIVGSLYSVAQLHSVHAVITLYLHHTCCHPQNYSIISFFFNQTTKSGASFYRRNIIVGNTNFWRCITYANGFGNCWSCIFRIHSEQFASHIGWWVVIHCGQRCTENLLQTWATCTKEAAQKFGFHRWQCASIHGPAKSAVPHFTIGFEWKLILNEHKTHRK